MSTRSTILFDFGNHDGSFATLCMPSGGRTDGPASVLAGTSASPKCHEVSGNGGEKNDVRAPFETQRTIARGRDEGAQQQEMQVEWSVAGAFGAEEMN